MTDTGMNVWRKALTVFFDVQRAKVPNMHDKPAAVITAAMAQDKAEHAEAVTNYRAALADCERLRMAAEAEIERLREALGLAADRLHWASVATPGITHKSAKELLAGWSQEARNVTDA